MPDAFVTSDDDVTPFPMPGTDGKWATSRFADPNDLRHDMHVNIVTFQPGAVELLAEAGWVFKTHMFLGLTIFFVFPFTRLVHIWSGFAAVGYALRPCQVVRTRRS